MMQRRGHNKRASATETHKSIVMKGMHGHPVERGAQRIRLSPFRLLLCLILLLHVKEAVRTHGFFCFAAMFGFRMARFLLIHVATMMLHRL